MYIIFLNPKNEFKSFLVNYGYYEHLYYRWKLFSLLNKDYPHKWRIEPFLMYDDGPIFYPPILRSTLNKKLAENDNDSEEEKATIAGRVNRHEKYYTVEERDITVLSKRNFNKFKKILKHLTVNQESISKAMLFCIINADCGYQIALTIVKSINLHSRRFTKVLAYVSLVFDIMFNCAVKMPSAFKYRKLYFFSEL